MVGHASQKARRQQLEIAREKRLALEAEKPARLAKFLGWTKEQILEKIRGAFPRKRPPCQCFLSGITGPKSRSPGRSS